MDQVPAHAGLNRRRRVGLAAGLVATVLYAWLALSSGLDRLADQADGADHGGVPQVWPFGTGHARAAARAALANGDPHAALTYASAALRSDPADAEAVGLLGEAARRSRDAGGAARAFGLAARLGWREPYTQLYWLNLSLARGNIRAAADHVDAILRQSPDYAGRNLLLAPFDATAAGRGELAARLVQKPAWAQAYFADTAAPEAGDPLARADVAGALALRHGVHDCALVAPVIEGLVRHGHSEAAALRTLHCGGLIPGQVAVPTDSRFALADPAHPPTALDWHFSDEGAINVSLRAVRGIRGRAVIVDNAGSVTLAFAEQPLLLAPGSYAVTWHARDAAGASSPAIEVALTCDTEGAPWLNKSPLDPDAATYRAQAGVPGGCSRQRLVLGIMGSAQGVAVGDIVVTSVADQNVAAKLDSPRPAG